MRTARLATACVATALALGLMQGTALASGAADGDAAQSPAVGIASEESAPSTLGSVLVRVNSKVVDSGASVRAGSVITFGGLPDGATVVVTDTSASPVNVNVSTPNNGSAKSSALPPARTFTIRMQSISAEVRELTISTKDARRFGVSVWPRQSNKSNLGAGVPLEVTFDRAVRSKRDKAAVERALTVTASKDIGPAGWFWVDNKKVVFRPKAYWPGNTTVNLTAGLGGVQLSDGTWGPNQVASTFRIGDQVVLQVDLKKHTMKYVRNGKTVKKLRISGGKRGWLTQSGTKILTAKIPHKRLYNPDPVEGWDVKVRWAIRVNDFGEYIHDATWNYRIGSANTSHGCTNLTYSDMEWLYKNTKFGDVAVYTGSRAKVGKRQYLSGYWNYSWNEWKRGSAL